MSVTKVKHLHQQSASLQYSLFHCWIILCSPATVSAASQSFLFGLGARSGRGRARPSRDRRSRRGGRGRAGRKQRRALRSLVQRWPALLPQAPPLKPAAGYPPSPTFADVQFRCLGASNCFTFCLTYNYVPKNSERMQVHQREFWGRRSKTIV